MLNKNTLGGILFTIILLMTIFFAICYYFFFSNEKLPSRGEYVENIIELEYGGNQGANLYQTI